MRHFVSVLVLALLLACGMSTSAFAASLGVKVTEVSGDEAKKFSLEPGLGLKVTAVKEGGAAHKAGIKEGMIIVAMDNKDIKTEDDLVAALKRAGSRMKVTVITDEGWEEDKVVVFEDNEEKSVPDKEKPAGKTRPEPADKPVEKQDDNAKGFTDEDLSELEEELMQMKKRINEILKKLREGKSSMPEEKPAKPEKEEPREKEKAEKPSEPKGSSPFLGVELESAPEGEKGVEVLRVLENSAAEKAGLQQYDIILKINDEPINTAQELRKHLVKAGVGGKLKMEVDRRGKIMEIVVTLTARPTEDQ